MSKHREAKDLTQGGIAPHLVHLALPILGTSFIQMLYSFIDMAWVGRLSAESVAATGAASVFTWLASSISLLNKVAAEVSVSNALGRHERQEARDYAGHTATLSLIMGGMVMFIYGLFSNSLIGVYELATHIHEMSVSYLRIVAFGMPLVFMTVSFTGIYNATGHSKIPFVISTIGLVLNILLDPLLIFVFDLGVEGAAYATVISQTVVLLLFLFQMLYKDQLLGGIKIITRLTKDITLSILRIGTPVALMNSLFAFINMSLGRLASLYGGHLGVMSLTTGGQLEGLCWNTAQGFSTALSAFVGQNYGANRYDRIFQGVRYTLILSLMVGVAGFFLYYFRGEALFALIVPEQAAYTAGGIYLGIQALPQIFSMLEITAQGFFYGVRKTLPPSLISIIGNLLRIPAALVLLPMTGQITTLWWVIAASSILKGVVSGAWYLYERGRRFRSLQTTESPQLSE
ncbi:MAG: MATE family efflux transporter [Porphyromonas sp.]|nr:MATE family efflux transporter [Porphyromonas sp.]